MRADDRARYRNDTPLGRDPLSDALKLFAATKRSPVVA